MKKIASLGAPLVRYFKRLATYVTPKKTPPIVRAFEARFENGKMILPDDVPPEVREAMEKIAAQHVPDLSGAHPPAPLDPIAALSWREWRDNAKAFIRPGWTFSRFAFRVLPSNTCGALFGWVNGDYAVARQPYHCCNIGDDEDGERILSSLLYLPAGAFVGVFVTDDMAAEAGEIMSRMSDDFSKVDWIDPSSATVSRVEEAWKAAGLYPTHFHAHPRGCNGHVEVWFKNHHSMTLGKPETFRGLS